MAYIEFAEELAEKFGEVVIVVDMGQEPTVVVCHSFPVNTVHIGSVEALTLLTLNIVEHKGTLCRGIEGLGRVELDRLR